MTVCYVANQTITSLVAVELSANSAAILRLIDVVQKIQGFGHSTYFGNRPA